MAHSSKIIRAGNPVSGLLSVTVRCCEDPKTDSVLTVHLSNASDEEVQQAIDTHRKKVEQLHAHDDRAERLMKKLGAQIGDCGCR